MRVGQWVLAMAIGGAAGVGSAAPPLADAPALQPLLGCRAITEPGARLACYDQNAARLAAATARRDVVVVDRRQVEAENRRRFGFSQGTPDLAARAMRVPQPVEMQGVLRSAATDSFGRWVLTLEDGAVWRQTDDNPIALAPRPGNPVSLRRATLGSYFLKVGKQPAIRARRAN